MAKQLWIKNVKDTKRMIRPSAIKKGYSIVEHKKWMYHEGEPKMGLRQPNGRIKTIMTPKIMREVLKD